MTVQSRSGGDSAFIKTVPLKKMIRLLILSVQRNDIASFSIYLFREPKMKENIVEVLQLSRVLGPQIRILPEYTYKKMIGFL